MLTLLPALVGSLAIRLKTYWLFFIFELPFIPLPLLNLSLAIHMPAITMQHSIFKEPFKVAITIINLSPPPISLIIFELSFVQEIIALSANALELSGFVNLAKTTCEVVFSHTKVVVDWDCGILNNVFSKENS